jgi:hypothetical protein
MRGINAGKRTGKYQRGLIRHGCDVIDDRVKAVIDFGAADVKIS